MFIHIIKKEIFKPNLLTFITTFFSFNLAVKCDKLSERGNPFGKQWKRTLKWRLFSDHGVPCSRSTSHAICVLKDSIKCIITDDRLLFKLYNVIRHFLNPLRWIVQFFAGHAQRLLAFEVALYDIVLRLLFHFSLFTFSVIKLHDLHCDKTTKCL